LGEDQLLFTTSAETDGERFVAFYRVLNPEKLRHTRMRMGCEQGCCGQEKP
jgi:hypothetical protein